MCSKLTITCATLVPMTLVVELRNDMEDCEEGNINALRDVDHVVVAFLKSGRRDSAVGMDEIE